MRCFKLSNFTGKLRASFSRLAAKAVVLVECQEEKDERKDEGKSSMEYTKEERKVPHNALRPTILSLVVVHVISHLDLNAMSIV